MFIGSGSFECLQSNRSKIPEALFIQASDLDATIDSKKDPLKCIGEVRCRPIQSNTSVTQFEFIPKTWGDRNRTKFPLALVKLVEKCIERFSRHSAPVETIRHQSERVIGRFWLMLADQLEKGGNFPWGSNPLEK